MRKIFSAIAIILGLAALVVGIGQRTIWAPPETLTASFAQAPAAAPVTLIEAGAGTVAGHPTEITINAEGKFTASLVRSADAKAWVGKAAHTTVTGINAADTVLESTSESGEDQVPNPAGDDIFQATENADKTMTYRWTNPDEGSWTLLLAADGKAAAPTDITATWPGDTATPFSMPLIIAGSLLLIAGIALAAVRTTPRGGSGGGRRSADQPDAPRTDALPTTAMPKGGENTVAKIVATASVLSLVLLPSAPALAAGSSSSPAESSATEEAEKVFPVVLQNQLERILGEVSTSVAKADKSRNIKDLDARTTGALKSLRGQNYELRNDDVKIDAPAAIDTSVIRSAAVPTDDGANFPRSIMVVTAKDSGASTIPTAITLTQSGPRENYKVAFATPMLPGSTFPGIAVGDQSVKMLKDDAKDLTMTPKTALERLAAFMDNEKAKDADKFAKNAFLTLNAKEQNAMVKSNKDATITFKRTVNAKDTVVLATPDGGALVSGSFTSTTTAKPKEDGGTVGMDATTAKIVGAKDTKKGVEITYGEPTLIYIPAADSKDKISVVAAEVITRGAKLLK
ncbi:hypothetical protein KRR55_11130 [Paeniglutamicibacter sp. ABSL32-1]|uniref:hypothetical protein n=1 Tax=Paeniglutamicibacter quisquiliarum TaxID=2849498 RepID=UPI001C2D11A6|nr:hypothetical protein [Paeniglutamicibacter quisquiliarum]MBV1779662.1 hypothetical protein [Paeniglutamicibacter quisquiliarum]